MHNKLLPALIIVLLACFGGLIFVMSRHIKAPVIVSRTDPPKIRFEENVHDFGNVAKGVEIPYVFKIHNVGGEPLIIKDVAGTCGCAVINLKDKYIDPGKTGDLEVVMNTAAESGYVRQVLTVLSNDPKRPDTKVRLVANVLSGMDTSQMLDKALENAK